MTEEKAAAKEDPSLTNREFLRLSKDNATLARQVALSCQSPEDAAQLIRKALYQLMLSVLPPDERRKVTTFAACRAQIEGNEQLEAIFADLLEELPFLDELLDSFGLMRNERAEWGDRFEGLGTKLRGAFERARRHIAAQPPEQKTMITPRRLALGGAIFGVAVVVSLIFLLSTPSGEEEEPPPVHEAETEQTAPPAPPFAVAWPEVPQEVLDDESKCFIGEYFRDTYFKDRVWTSRDCRIFFDWGTGSPHENVPVDEFSVRWTGTLRVPTSGEYFITGGNDDGLRISLDGEKIVVDWAAHPYKETESRGLMLEAGRPYAIKIEYFEVQLWALAAVFVRGPNLERQPLPGGWITHHDEGQEEQAPAEAPIVDAPGGG